jgi:Mg2+/citrate symporter
VGRIFMRKYPVLFGTFSRLMGFYINKNIKTEKEKKEQKEEQKVIDKINSNNSSNKNYLVYILIIIVALVFTIVGLLIGKKIFFMRRKRANELTDDYYQYDTEKKDIKNDNLTSANIEMNSKLGLK